MRAARSNCGMEEEKVPWSRLPSSSKPPLERGKNSYQEPKRASRRSTRTLRVLPRVSSSRSGCSSRMPRVSSDRAGETRARSSASERSDWATPRRCERYTVAAPAAARSNRRAPISRSLASSSSVCPASIFLVTALRQVAIGSDHASTRKVHRPGASGTNVALTWFGSWSLTRMGMRWVRAAKEDSFGPLTFRVALSASWPSRQTTAKTGTTSPATALDGVAPPSTWGRTSSIPSRPVTFESPSRRVRRF